MSNVLDEICARKRLHIEEKNAAVPLAAVQEKAKNAPAPRGFIQSLKSGAQPCIIAEIKKASPSKGIIRADFDPVEIARIYEQNGACCLSVLTDEPYFQGHDAYFEQVRTATALPLLRKDFMLEPYQIYESRALGADCILLIMAALSDAQTRILYDLARELGMDALVEIHDREELDRALSLAPQMIGINNRSLKTLRVDTQTSFDLLPFMPPQTLKVAESGLESFETVNALQKAGFEAFLIGESLMRQPDIGAALRKIRGTGLDTDQELN